MTETVFKKDMKEFGTRLPKIGIDNLYYSTAPAQLMPNFTGPRTHNDHGAIDTTWLECKTRF